MPSNHLILCCPLLLLPSIFPGIRVFSDKSALRIRWPKYWSFSFSISSSNEYSGLISFRMDWLDLLAVQGTLKSLRQYYSSKHQFFGTQLSFCRSMQSQRPFRPKERAGRLSPQCECQNLWTCVKTNHTSWFTVGKQVKDSNS